MEKFFVGMALIEQSGTTPPCLHGIGHSEFQEVDSIWKLAKVVALRFKTSWRENIEFDVPPPPDGRYDYEGIIYELIAFSPSMVKQFSYAVDEIARTL